VNVAPSVSPHWFISPSLSSSSEDIYEITSKKSADGEALNISILISNISATPLKIEEIKGECTCFIKTENKAIIAPYSSKEFYVKFNATKFNFESGSSVIVVSNDIKAPLLMTQILPNKEMFEFNKDQKIVKYPQSLSQLL
jgi:hypothetical protein